MFVPNPPTKTSLPLLLPLYSSFYLSYSSLNFTNQARSLIGRTATWFYKSHLSPSEADHFVRALPVTHVVKQAGETDAKPFFHLATSGDPNGVLLLAAILLLLILICH